MGLNSKVLLYRLMWIFYPLWASFLTGVVACILMSLQLKPVGNLIVYVALIGFLYAGFAVSRFVDRHFLYKLMTTLFYYFLGAIFGAAVIWSTACSFCPDCSH